VYLYDGVLEKEFEYYSNFLEYAANIDILLDVFDYMNHLLEKLENVNSK
jgi:hypothetical protein